MSGEGVNSGAAAHARTKGPIADLTGLRRLAIVAPLVFLVGLFYLLHAGFSWLHDFPGVLISFGLLAVVVTGFSFAVFGIVSRLERRIQQRNQELAALLAVGRAAGSSLDVDELVDKALREIVEVTSAEAAEVWLVDADGDLVLARNRGLAEEAFRERVRLRFGEGLPGLAAQRGAPIVVHDLADDERFLRTSVKRLGFQTFCALPLRYRGEVHGVLGVASRDRHAMDGEAERGLLEGIGERMAIAIENSRLHERVLDGAVLQERERIARELHDGLAQVLGYINTETLAVQQFLESGRTDRARVELEAMERATKAVYADVREAIFGLRVPVDGGTGLVPAVRSFLQEYSEMSGAPRDVAVEEVATVPRLDASSELQLVRIVQEALSNVRKHARADRVGVTFAIDSGQLLVSVRDDGRGFRPEQRTRTGWPHLGLQTMRERAEAIGGSVAVASAPGQGAEVSVRVPLEAEEGASR